MNYNLYLIVPFFNFQKNKLAEENLNLFLDQKFSEQVKVIIVQGLIDNEQPIKLRNRVYKHLAVRIPNKLWLQNNLINYAIKQLPDDWNYVSWCDRDIIFCDTSWSNKAINKLKEVDILQPFSDCFHLNEHGAVDFENQKKLFKAGFGEKNFYFITSFCKHFVSNGPNIDFDIYRHTGHVWAANRTFFQKTEFRLFDEAFLGAADIVLASSIKQKENLYYKQLFKNKYIKYYNFFSDNKISVGYCDGVILHRSHGSIENRQYNSRYDPFTKDPYFNIDLDIGRNQDGILYVTERGKRFLKYIDWYFSSRN